MTNIINDIDVGEWELKGVLIPITECKYFEGIGDCKESKRLCVDNDDCYFKQLKRLQEENKELKKHIKDLQVRKDRYYLQVLEFEKQINDWVTFYMKINDIVSGNYEILDCQGLQDLRQIISEVLNDRD